MAVNTTKNLTPAPTGRPGDTFGAAQFDRAGGQAPSAAPVAKAAKAPAPHPIPAVRVAPLDTSFHPQALDGLRQAVRLIGSLSSHVNNAQGAGQVADALTALAVAFSEGAMICNAIRSSDPAAASRVNGAIGQLSAAAAAWVARSIK